MPQKDARKLGPFGMKTTEITELPTWVSSHRDLTGEQTDAMIVNEVNRLGTMQFAAIVPLLNWALISQSKNNASENILATGKIKPVTY